jgi:hypothetical protein
VPDEARFLIRRLDAPPKSLKQGCSCGGAVLAKEEFFKPPEVDAAAPPPASEPPSRDGD